MGRKTVLKESLIVSCRIEGDEYQKLRDIAALESLSTGKTVTVQSLIRDAVRYVYSDNERLRECFRRTREMVRRKYKY